MLTSYLSILQLHVLFLPIVHHRFEVEATKKSKVYSAYYIWLTHPILNKKNLKITTFFSIFLPLLLAVYSLYLKDTFILQL